MAVIEITTFRLAEGADEEGFLLADKKVQAEVAVLADGFLRRTTARGDDGEWLVSTLWRSRADLDAASGVIAAAAAAVEFAGFVDPLTIVRRSFGTLE